MVAAAVVVPHIPAVPEVGQNPVEGTLELRRVMGIHHSPVPAVGTRHTPADCSRQIARAPDSPRIPVVDSHIGAEHHSLEVRNHPDQMVQRWVAEFHPVEDHFSSPREPLPQLIEHWVVAL